MRSSGPLSLCQLCRQHRAFARTRCADPDPGWQRQLTSHRCDQHDSARSTAPTRSRDLGGPGLGIDQRLAPLNPSSVRVTAQDFNLHVTAPGHQVAMTLRQQRRPGCHEERPRPDPGHGSASTVGTPCSTAKGTDRPNPLPRPLESHAGQATNVAMQPWLPRLRHTVQPAPHPGLVTPPRRHPAIRITPMLYCHARGSGLAFIDP